MVRLLPHTACQQGDHFGELALLNPLGVRAATVETLEPSELLRIDRADFQRVTRVGSKVAKREASSASGGAWAARARGLHTAAFGGDIGGLEQSLGPETRAHVSSLRARKKVIGAQRRLGAATQAVDRWRGELEAGQARLDGVIGQETRTGKKAVCRPFLASGAAPSIFG